MDLAMNDCRDLDSEFSAKAHAPDHYKNDRSLGL